MKIPRFEQKTKGGKEKMDVTTVEEVGDISNLKPVDRGGTDLEQFEGQKVKIESVTRLVVPSKFTESGNQEVLKVQSVPVTVVEDSEGNKIEIRASELFNLVDSTSWSTKGKLQKFLDKQRVSHPKDLPGTWATIRLREKAREDGTTQTFLGFVI